MTPVRELRVAVTVEDFDEAVRFYRDVFGLPVLEAWENPGGRSGAILDAGHATLELLSTAQTAVVDEIEGGSSPPIRLALEVDDSDDTAERLEAAGARRLGGPVVTPWQHRNVRLEAPGAQLTLFTVLDRTRRGGGEAAQAEPEREDAALPRPPGHG
jgi:catechol 2,3-dioxygenase-like lactoylglutathione lyase family enzyme